MCHLILDKLYYHGLRLKCYGLVSTVSCTNSPKYARNCRYQTIALQTQSMLIQFIQYKMTHIKNVTYLQTQLLVDMNNTLTKPPKQNRSIPLLQTQNEISHPPHPTNCKLPTHMQIQLIVKCFMYNMKMASIDGRNMQLYLSNSKRTTRNIVVFVTIYIYTINLFLICREFLDQLQNCQFLKDYVPCSL